MKRQNDFQEHTGQKIQKIDYSDNPLKEFEIESEEEIEVDDSLDAYMAIINKELVEPAPKPQIKSKVRRDDIEEEDQIESFLNFQTKQKKDLEKKAAQHGKTVEQFAAEQEEYDDDDNPIKNKKEFDILPPLDYSNIVYDPPIGSFKEIFLHCA
jgi:hypothetical protein